MPYPSELVYPPRRRDMPLTPERITQVYQGSLGRTPTPEDIDVHMRNPGGYRGFVNTVVTSEEGRGRGLTPEDVVYRRNRPATTDRPTGPGASPELTAPVAYTADRNYYAPFNWDRAQDESRSAKDTFLAGSQSGASDLRWQRRETAGAWFDQYIRPRMEARGWTVHQVNGDKAFVSTRESQEAGLPGAWIDWVERIDGENPRLTWQDETMGGGAAPRGGPVNTGGDFRATGAPPSPTFHDDGTVSIRVSPEMARRLSTQQYRRRRRPVADYLSPTSPEVVP
jgi:hypothetical protein